MVRDRVIAVLRLHETELKRLGVEHLSLFGSKARGDDTAESDIDLMAEFDSAKKLSILELLALENRLADILGLPVDLASAKALKECVREQASSEAVVAF